MKYNNISILSFTIFTASTLLANTVHIQVPTAISPPEVTVKVISPIKIHSDEKKIAPLNVNQNKTLNKAIGFSKRVPPDYKNINETIAPGISPDNNISTVSAFLTFKIIPIEVIRENLKKNNFSILTEYKVDKKGLITSIVFTNKAITKNASKNERGFAGTLRLLINKQSGIISITNPVYLMKAFLQEDYNNLLAQQTLKTLNNTFSNLENSKDIVKYTKLDHYRYMDNMPYYQDMEVIASGSNQKLLENARKSKKVIYEHILENGSVAIGIELSKRTRKFVKKIGYQNAGLLPYPILIENNQAKTLAPQYYIALMYPMLNMTQFMSIASIPGAILKDCNRVFKDR